MPVIKTLPGYSVALEPGVTLTRGANTVSWTMPLAVRRHATLSIADERTGNPIGGIAALADRMLNVAPPTRRRRFRATAPDLQCDRGVFC